MKVPINVLHLIDHYKIGGPGKTIINSAKYIDNKKYRIHIASFINGLDQQREFSDAVLSAGIPYLALTDKKGIQFEYISKLKDYIADNKIEILHTHIYKADFIGLIVRFFIKNLILVTTHHGWITKNSRQKLFVKIDILFSKYFDGVICVSEQLVGMLPKKVINSDKLALVHNALVLNDYQLENQRKNVRAMYSIKNNEVLIGICGRLSKEKGCIEALDAFYQVQKEQNNIKLIYIGDGPLLHELKIRTKSLALTNNVIFAGYQNPVQSFYEAVDILLSPSHTEGLSNVILEAMVYNLPIIATKVGGNAEIIKHNFNGLLVEPKDKIQLKNGILRMLRNPQFRLSVSSKGYQTVKNKFNFNERMKKIEAFYSKLLNHKG